MKRDTKGKLDPFDAEMRRTFFCFERTLVDRMEQLRMNFVKALQWEKGGVPTEKQQQRLAGLVAEKEELLGKAEVALLEAKYLGESIEAGPGLSAMRLEACIARLKEAAEDAEVVIGGRTTSGRTKV